MVFQTILDSKMPDTFTLPTDVTKARENAISLTGAATEYKVGEATISDVLKQKVQDAYGNNKDILGGLDTSTAGYLSAPSAAREKYQGVFNPFTRESLVDQYVANTLIPMLSYSSLYGQRMGRIEDTIGAGTRAYQAESARKESTAKAASDLYTNLLNEYVSLQQLNLRQQEINKPAAGGMDFGIDKTMMAEIVSGKDLDGDGLIGGIFPAEETGQQYESPPMSSGPVAGNEVEYPKGSGIIWISDGRGGWR